MLMFGSLFTGVGGFDLGFERAGMKCAWQCEIDSHARKVLDRHWEKVRKFEDVRNITGNDAESVDVIAGGFPCQDVSVAGKRAGFAGERSGLWFEFARVISELKPRWVVIENVPGLLSSNQGRDFETVLSALVEFGYGVSWRILDAQFFGVPQRRHRVFIVESLGNGRAAEVLFERFGLRGDIAPGGKEGSGYSGAVANCITTREGQRLNETIETLIPVMMEYGNDRAIGIDVAPALKTAAAKSPLIPVMVENGYKQIFEFDKTPTMKADKPPIVWDFHHGEVRLQEKGTAPTLTSHYGTGGNNTAFVNVRRLTPVECCRLQGFPDDWNDNVSDTQRYKQMGNAVCVNVAEWIGKRIMQSEER